MTRMASEIGSLIPHHMRPAGWVNHLFQRTRPVRADMDALWSWLNTPETFTRQLWPYRVEFVEKSGVDGTSGFSLGVLNIHTGPFLHAAGVITRLDDLTDGDTLVRDLHYTYGSYMIALRLVRPALLRFTARCDDESLVELTVRVESFTRPWFVGTWTRTQSVFWSTFFGSARRGAAKHARRHVAS